MRGHFGRLFPIAALTTSLFACSDDGNAGANDEYAGANDESSSSSGAPETATATQGMSSTSASTTATSTTEPADTGIDSSEDSMGFINPESGGEEGPQEPGPNGAECGGNDECESGFCYQVPMLGGVCSECLMDADCGTGTCSLDLQMLFAVCTPGELGNMCDSDEGCMGELVCTQLIDTGGLFNLSFCSECGESAPCMGDQVCNPTYDAQGIGGYLTCVDPGSVPDGEGCPLAGGMGDGTVCTSGHCTPADIFMGFVQIGVCGECTTDADCPDGGTCTPASGGMGGLTGATCT